MRNVARRVAIVGGVRTPFVRSFGHYAARSNQEMLTFLLQEMTKRYGLEGRVLGEVALGAVLKSAKDFNLAREAVLGAGLDPRTPALDLQRACGTGLEAVALIASRIAMGQIDVGIAGGSDTNSDLPMEITPALKARLSALTGRTSLASIVAALEGTKLRDWIPSAPNVDEPRTGKRMGDHAEEMAKAWGLTREEQDELALLSHRHAARAYQESFYDGLIVPYEGVERDQFVRADTSLEKLASLKPAFDRQGGSLTAGNSTPLTDGAALVLLASEEYAKTHGLPILAVFTDFQSAAVDFVKGKEGLLMAPTYAVSAILSRNQRSLQDFSYYEIHEAFSAQALCNFKAWESESFCRETLGRDEALGSIDRQRLNVCGGSVALGHPFAATGARLVANASQLLYQEPGQHRSALLSACTAGGMGVAAIIEAA